MALGIPTYVICEGRRIQVCEVCGDDLPADWNGTMCLACEGEAMQPDDGERWDQDFGSDYDD